MEKVCIVCPIGCNLIMEEDDSEPIGYSITGYKCSRGKEYAIKELTNPTRVVTSTVKIKSFPSTMLPIKTSEGIPKDKTFELMDSIKSIEVSLPIHSGDVIMANLYGINIDLIATKTILA